MVIQNKKSPFLRIQYISVKDNSSRTFMDYDFFYILDGTVRVNADSKTYLLSKGDVYMFEPENKYIVSSGGNNLILSVVLDKTFPNSYNQDKRGKYIMNSAYDSSRDYEPVRQYLVQIAATYSGNSSKKDIKLMSLAFSLLYYMEEYHFEEETNLSDDDQLSKSDRIQTILQHINANYANQITLNDLATSMSLSVPYLSTYFKQNTRTTFNTYLNQVRLDHAVEELIYSEKSITEIAYNNGFSSTNAFHKLFKEKYGTTPHKFRSETAKDRTFNNIDYASTTDEVSFETIDPNLVLGTHNSSNYLNEILLPTQESIHINDMSYYKSINPIWRSMINVGDIGSFDYRFLERQLSRIQENIGFTYARFFNVAKINDGSLLYQLDTCIDTLETYNLKAYFDFSIPLKDLEIVGSKIIVDTESYLQLLEEIITHCANVHGLDYIANWHFEINPHTDPDNKYYEDPDDFIDRFEKTYNLIKSYSLKAKVGGICHDLMYDPKYPVYVFDQIKSRGIIPDFISCGGYPLDISESILNSNYAIYSEDKDYYLNKCREYKALIREVYNTDLPFHLNFIAPIKGNQLFLNDTCFQSSFLFHNIVSLIDEVDILGIYKLSDIDENQIHMTDYLSGTPGLINRYGLEKPGAHVLYTFAKCRTNLVKKGEDFIVLKGNVDRYMIGFCNHTYISDIYRYNLDSDIPISDAYNVFEHPKTKNIELELNNLTPGTYELIQLQINKDYGSILNEWERNNYWNGFNKDELDHLKGINRPKRTHLTKEAPDGTIKMQIQLVPHEVMFIALFLKV